MEWGRGGQSTGAAGAQGPRIGHLPRKHTPPMRGDAGAGAAAAPVPPSVSPQGVVWIVRGLHPARFSKISHFHQGTGRGGGGGGTRAATARARNNSTTTRPARHTCGRTLKRRDQGVVASTLVRVGGAPARVGAGVPTAQRQQARRSAVAGARRRLPRRLPGGHWRTDRGGRAAVASMLTHPAHKQRSVRGRHALARGPRAPVWPTAGVEEISFVPVPTLRCL